MRVDAFDFDLPQELIALRPANPRDSARLMQIDAWGVPASITHHHVYDLADLLKPGDCLVVNNTKVLPARLFGFRVHAESSAKIEVLLHKRLDANTWRAFARPAKKLHEGDALSFGAEGALTANVVRCYEGGEVDIVFAQSGAALNAAIALHGVLPLPPYIAGKRAADSQDAEDYQTHFAKDVGSVAAPTAGLHFTPQLLEKLTARGILREELTLHVGAGTFLPVKVEDTNDHVMHAEFGSVPEDVAARLNQVRANGGRIIAVGTTSLRTLEAACDAHGNIKPFAGDIDLFITPGYQFRAIDALMTNFHLPRSTLFMLVSALCGVETMQAAYKTAIDYHYRFYSYGDASLLWPASSALAVRGLV